MRRAWLFTLVSACSETFPRPVESDVIDSRIGLDARPVSTTCRAGPRPTSKPAIVSFERASAATFVAPVDIVRKDGILYVLEQRGRVLRVEGDAASTVIDISSKVVTGGEAGLLGVAFHPRFSENSRATR
jgi:hypothetical protein